MTRRQPRQFDIIDLYTCTVIAHTEACSALEAMGKTQRFREAFSTGATTARPSPATITKREAASAGTYQGGRFDPNHFQYERRQARPPAAVVAVPELLAAWAKAFDAARS